MYYYFIIAFQAFCLYHAYKNKNNYYWYFIIFFIPLFGCIIYLLTQVINKRDVTNITDEITTIINPTKKIKDLEKVLEFSNTFQNRINLADAYSQNRDYNAAILQYEKALESNFKDDPHTLNKLVHCYFETKNYKKVIEYSKKINIEKDFKHTIYFYGLALEQIGEFEKAEIQLRKIDIRYSNYSERLEFSRFLIRHQKKEEAKELLNEITAEIKSMTTVNYRKHRNVFVTAEKILNDV
jgi:hypothetical protein